VESRDQEHAVQCPDCARRVAILREYLAQGIDEVAFEARQVDALLAELAAERQTRWTRLVREPRFHRAALARRLVSLALAARDSDTRLAIGYSETATVIVERMIGEHPEIADLRFDVWRYHSMLLREIGQYFLCGKAFETADEAANGTADPELSQAIIALSRALLAIEPDIWQPEKGRALLQDAERVFERRDPARLRLTKIAYGMLARRAGEYETAAGIFSEILSVTSADDENAYADALGNYLSAAIRCGRVDDNEIAKLDVLDEIDSRGRRQVNLLRNQWQRGFIYLARNAADDASPLLRDAMRGFKAHGYDDEAIRVGIDVVRSLLLAERYEDATELARDLASDAIGLDRREPTRRHTLTVEAMTYLREAAMRKMLTGDLAEWVAQYIDKITSQRPVDFLPPMPLHAM
jgi:tetratricopeptide (TPR) repeat protein